MFGLRKKSFIEVKTVKTIKTVKPTQEEVKVETKEETKEVQDIQQLTINENSLAAVQKTKEIRETSSKRLALNLSKSIFDIEMKNEMLEGNLVELDRYEQKFLHDIEKMINIESEDKIKLFDEIQKARSQRRWLKNEKSILDYINKNSTFENIYSKDIRREYAKIKKTESDFKEGRYEFNSLKKTFNFTKDKHLKTILEKTKDTYDVQIVDEENGEVRCYNYVNRKNLKDRKVYSI